MRNLKIVAVGLIVLQFLLPVSAEAQQVIDFTIHQEYTSTRALGMGNAFTAVTDDHSALFYNPAALARRKDGQLRMFLRGGIDQSYLDLLENIENVDGEGTESEQITEINDLINSHYGDHFYSRVPTIGGVWVRPNWGVAVVPADLSIDIVAHNNVGPTLNISGYLDTTIAYGYARNVNWLGKKDQFSVGATVKALHRAQISKQVLASQLVQEDVEIFDLEQDAREGMTLDVDLGALWTPKLSKSSWWRFSKPTLALVMRNSADYGFPMQFGLFSDKSEEPEKLQRRIDFGSKFELPRFWVFDPKVAVDVRDMLHPNWSPIKGLHAGAEMYWKVFNWWKGHWSVGLNQGYWTAGFGARLAWFQIDLASWGEEVGTSDAKKESRRYIVELSLDF